MPSICKDCSKEFASPQSLCNHRRRKHQNKENFRGHHYGGIISDKNNSTSDLLKIHKPIPAHETDNETDSNSDECLSEICEINEPIPVHKVTSDESALQSLIAREKMELLKLLEEFVEVVDKEDESKLIELEKLLNDFFISKIKYSEEIGPKWETLPKVHSQLDGLKYSKIPRSELEKAKMLVNNLDKKRHIFQEIQQGIKNGQVDDTLNRLRYQMIGSNMFDKIKELDEMNFENIAAIINSGLHVNFD